MKAPHLHLPHLHLPHFHHHHEIPLSTLKPRRVIDPHVVDVDREPERFVFHYDDGARLVIWPAKRLAHKANIYLPDGEIIYLCAERPPADSIIAELYLYPAYRFVEGCIQDHSRMIQRTRLRDDSVKDAHFAHRLLHTPFIWENLHYDFSKP